ncbi:MAG TPA: SnoaL-like domain-containing protein [Tepidisphaeraceae bacterium]|jgi:hypothetical protein
MSIESVALKFVELCKQGKHFEVMRTMYSDDMVSVEGDGRETVGKEPVIHKSEVFQGNNNIDSQDLRGPFYCGDSKADSGKFAVYFNIGFTPKKGGEHQTHQEVGLYTVKNNMITREEFFYDGPFI